MLRGADVSLPKLWDFSLNLEGVLLVDGNSNDVITVSLDLGKAVGVVGYNSLVGDLDVRGLNGELIDQRHDCCKVKAWVVFRSLDRKQKPLFVGLLPWETRNSRGLKISFFDWPKTTWLQKNSPSATRVIYHWSAVKSDVYFCSRRGLRFGIRQNSERSNRVFDQTPNAYVRTGNDSSSVTKSLYHLKGILSCIVRCSPLLFNAAI